MANCQNVKLHLPSSANIHPRVQATSIHRYNKRQKDYICSQRSHVMSVSMSHRKSTGLRRASNYKPVEIAQINTNGYPANSPSSIGALHDIGYYEGLLSNTSNFSQVSSLEIVEVLNGKTIERRLMDDATCQAYLEVSIARREMEEPLVNLLSSA